MSAVDDAVAVMDAAKAEIVRLRAANAALLSAAEEVLCGLHERIDNAPEDAVPVFQGIVALYDAIALAKE